LLIISPHYLTFVKDATESLASEFERIDVIVPINPIFQPIIELPFSKIVRRWSLFEKNKIVDYNNKPENIIIHQLSSIYYLPILLINKFSLFLVYDVLAQHFIKFIKSENITFDLIQAHFTYPFGYIGKKIKGRYNKPLIITGHGFDVYALPFVSNKMKELVISGLRESDHIITVSNRNKKIMDEFPIVNPVTVLPNGYDEKRFHSMDIVKSRNQLNLPTDKTILLSIGNIEPVKGHANLVEAIRIISRSNKNILCILIGSGSLHSTIKSQIDSFRIGDIVMMVGRISHDEIPLWINSCDFFVLPSLNEGNPTVMFEALGCGKPFIGTRVGGVPEVITSDDYGLLVEPANPEDLAEKIMIALDREWDQKKILDYAAQYTWENIAKQIMGVYERVLKETP
jgi:glycosyltransferase involved in cell wall biosynthesis